MKRSVPVALAAPAALLLVVACRGEIGDASPAAARGTGGRSETDGGGTTGTGRASGTGGSTGAGATTLPLATVLAAPDTCTHDTPGPRKLWRLTAPQFAASIRTIFNDPAAPVTTVFSDPSVLGFSIDSNGLLVQGLNASQLEDNAEAIAAWAASSNKLSAFAACAASTAAPPSSSCATAFIQAFGRAAFRTTLGSDDPRISSYGTLFMTGTSNADGAQIVISAMLQSPYFLYRSELGAPSGGAFALTPYEVATELAYTLTGTTPDSTLLGAADSVSAGHSSLSSMIDQQAGRLLAGSSAGSATAVMGYGGANGGNLPTIGSPLSAYSTVFGAAMPSAASAPSLMRRRKSILDTITGEITTVQGTLGSNERAKLDAHLDSIRQLENKLQGSAGSGGGCPKPNPPGVDSTFQFMSDMDAIAANLIHQQIIVSAFACDITRVACLEYGNDQKLMVNAAGLPYDDQHGDFIHSGAASHFANLVKFEAYLATQFANIVTALKAMPDPLGSAGQTLFDNTLMVWARDMGDAQNHNQQSMRFVLASGDGGYLKTAPGGRYVTSTERHERLLLNLCDAFGITDFTGFGDPHLPNKTPLPNISA